MEIPRANPLPTGVTDQSLGRGLATGLETGNKMGYIASQTTAQDLANQAARYAMTPEMRALAIQKQQAEIKKQEAEAQKIQQEQGLALMKGAAEGYDRWGDDAGPELMNTFKKGANMVAPGSIPDNWQFTSDMGGVMKQAGKAVDALQNGEATLQDTMYFLTKLKAKASKVQQERLQGVLQPVEAMFTQEQTQKRTEQNIGAENTRKAMDEVKTYETSVRPYVDAHNNFLQMQKIANQADKSGTNVDPWSFLNAYVHTVDPSFSGVLNAQTYKDLRTAGSPVVSMIPGGEKYLTSSKLDPSDAMRMLTIAKHQDKLHTTRVSDLRGVTQKLVKGLGADPNLVQDFMTPVPKTKVASDGNTYITTDGGATWHRQ